MVDDVDAALAFYTTHLGFKPLSNAAPAFADITRGNLRLLLSGRTSSAGRPMPDGRQAVPGGWNRIHLIVDDIRSEVDRLRAEGVIFRNAYRFPTSPAVLSIAGVCGSKPKTAAAAITVSNPQST